MSFRIGDKVKVVKDHDIWLTNHDLPKETILTVVKDDDDTLDFVDPNEKTVELHGVITYPNDFVLVESSPVFIVSEQSARVDIDNAIGTRCAIDLSILPANVVKAPVKSDGGSSSYYDIPLPAEFIKKLVERLEAGNPHIRTEELIRYVYDNDFDFGTLFKSSVRAHGCIKGGGKAGNDVAYDCNKVVYYATKIKEIHS